MRAPSILLVLVSVSACASSPPPQGMLLAQAPPAAPDSSRRKDPPAARPPPEPLIAEMMKRLDVAAGCPASKRVWCVATAGWDSGTAADLPAAGVLAGLSIGLERDRPDAELLETEVSMSALAVKDGKSFITDIHTVNAAEKKTVEQSIPRVANAIKSGGPVELKASLTRYLRTLPDSARFPLTRGPAGWQMSGDAATWIRRAPSGPWIVVEVPGRGPIGIYVSIYPGTWLKPGPPSP